MSLVVSSDSRRLVRQPRWERRLLAWSKAVRGQPFEWGRTDCAALVREALLLQFKEDVVDDVPYWTSASTALSVWQPMLRNGGPVDLLRKLGAKEVTRRYGAHYPMGTILVLPRNPVHDDMRFPAFGVFIGPFTVESNWKDGVVWVMQFAVKSAWLLESVVRPYG